MTIWDLINSINDKNYRWNDTIRKSDYSQWTVNTFYSFFPDTIFLANEINKYGGITNREHYDFMFYATSKRNRKSKWFKHQKNNLIDELCDAYGVNHEKMKDILEVLTKDQIDELKSKMYKGGK